MFFDQGYQCFPDIYRPVEINSATQAVETICHEMKPEHPLQKRNMTFLSELNAHRNPGLARDTLQGILFLIGELPAYSDSLKDFILNEKLWNITKEVLGSNELVYHFSNVTRKPAHVGPNISWHRDYPNRYICPQKSHDFIRFLIPLEGMNLENGCTEVVPNSHEITDEDAIRAEKKMDFDFSSSVPLEAKAGDIVMLHPKLLHGGRENRSNRERNLIVIQLGLKTESFLYWNEEVFSGLGREEMVKSALPFSRGKGA